MIAAWNISDVNTSVEENTDDAESIGSTTVTVPNPLGDDIDVTLCSEPTTVCQAPNFQANASASTSITVTIVMGDEVVFQDTVPVEISSDE